eukprot:1509295-Pyramimonas_sp.AAC.1
MRARSSGARSGGLRRPHPPGAGAPRAPPWWANRPAAPPRRERLRGRPPQGDQPRKEYPEGGIQRLVGRAEAGLARRRVPSEKMRYYLAR